MTAAPPVHHPVDSGMPGHLVNLPRYHPIAMNPNPPPHPMPPPEQMVQSHHFRHFAPMHEHHSSGVPPVHSPASLEHIEARLRHLEHEEMARMATRSRILAMRKHEDEEFRSMTERAEAEEEDLRRQRKKLKRESMGLGPNASADSPPLRPTPPRRLSETSAATTLAFFKQQSPPEPRQTPLPPPSQATPMPPPSHIHTQPHHHPAPPPPPPSQHPHAHPIVAHDSIHGGSIRRKQKYTIKNVEAWGERHGRPAAHDPSGRALWKRPSDGSLVYLTCPIHGCNKSDFVTLHGFMCHLTKKHKDRTLGSQSRALEVCGVVYDPSAPLPPVMNTHRASTEESPHSVHMDQDQDHDPEQDLGDGDEMDSDSEADIDRDPSYRVKAELPDRDRYMPDAEGTPVDSSNAATPPKPAFLNGGIGSTKQSISSIIDRTPDSEPREVLAHLPPSEAVGQGPSPTPTESSVSGLKRKFEYSQPEKENTEPRDGVHE